MKHIIEVKNLHKAYGNIKAVKGIDFHVEKGSLFSFLGPNGAGKSTTIDMICTFLKQDSGSIIINGYEVGLDDDKIRKDIGVVFQDGVLDHLLTIEDNLKFRGQLYGLKGSVLKNAIAHVASITGVTTYLKRPYGKLSGGQRRRCDIARALIHTPQILFLDEPTTGLDPQTRKHIWETIQQIQKESGMTIFLTTHYMEEAEISDYIVMIDNGIIVAKGSPDLIKKNYATDRLICTYHNLDEIKNILEHENIKYKIVSNHMEISIESTLSAIPILQNIKPWITSFEVVKGSMNDCFLNITGKEIRE